MIAPSIIALLPSRDESLYETATFFGISPMLGAAIYPRSPDRDSIATDCPQDCPTETSLEGVHLARLNNNSARPALPAAGGNDTPVARPRPPLLVQIIFDLLTCRGIFGLCRFNAIDCRPRIECFNQHFSGRIAAIAGNSSKQDGRGSFLADNARYAVGARRSNPRINGDVDDVAILLTRLEDRLERYLPRLGARAY